MSDIPDELSLAPEVSEQHHSLAPTPLQTEGALSALESLGESEAALDAWYARAKTDIAEKRQSLQDLVTLFMLDLRRTDQKSIVLHRDKESTWDLASRAIGAKIVRDNDAFVALLKERGLWDEDEMMTVPKPPAAKPAWSKVMKLVKWKGNRAKLPDGSEVPAAVLQKAKPPVPITVELTVGMVGKPG